MSTVGDRIRKARRALGLSASEAGERAGVTRVSWERYELNKSEPKPAPLKMLVESGVSADWLITGEGPMLRADLQATRSARPEGDAPTPPSHPDTGPVAQPAALPSDLARRLGLPEGASVAEAVQAIEARATTTPSTTTLSRNEVATMIEARTESLRDEIRSQFQSLTDAADPPATRPNPDPDLLERLANVASTICRDANVTLPPASLTAEAVIMFNDLVAHVSDLSDPDEIAAVMPLVKYNLQKRLKDAMDNPGAGKCGA